MSFSILDRIRSATLPQDWSLGLQISHGRLLEHLARGEDLAQILRVFIEATERYLAGWDLVGLFDLGRGSEVLGGRLSRPAGEDSSERLSLRLARLPKETVLRVADGTVRPDLWAAALPSYPIGHFAVFPVSSASVLIVLSNGRDRLQPGEITLLQLAAECARLVVEASVGRAAPPSVEPMRVMSLPLAPPEPIPPPPAEPEVRLDQICYGLLWRLTTNAVCLIDPIGQILSGNDRLGEILGCGVENTVGRRLEDLLAQGDSGAPIALGPEPKEHLFRHWDGSLLRLNVRGSDLVDPSKGHLGRLVVLEPIVEPPPRSAPVSPSFAASGESTMDRLSAILRASADGVIAVDAQGQVALMNQAAERMTGVNFARAQGQPLGSVCLLNAGGEHPVFGDWQQLAERTHGWQTDLHISSGVLDQGQFKIEVGAAMTPVVSAAGEFGGAVLCLRDITEMNNHLRERADAEHFKSLSLLAGGIAHDLNNILTALVGNISLANILVSDMPEVSDRLVEAERACFRAKDLSHQLLTFSKGGSPVRKVARLEDLINQSVEFYLRGSRAVAKIIVKPGLWSVNIDESQISQVLEHLIINADHSMPEGGNITVTCQNFHYSPAQASQKLPLEEGFYVKVSIADEGEGIPYEHLEHIFKPYYTTRELSHGLGLATTYTIVKNHQGHISVSSAVGAGTEFTVYLPATGTTKGMEATTNAGGGGLHAKREYPGRILVVDDEKSIRDLASTTLELMGCEVISCRSSTEGVQTFLKAREEGKPFDLVIMDLTIPGDLGGNEAMQQILRIQPDARGIASSGYSEGNIMAHYREYGFQAALSKPYNIGDLQRVVSTMLQG